MMRKTVGPRTTEPAATHNEHFITTYKKRTRLRMKHASAGAVGVTGFEPTPLNIVCQIITKIVKLEGTDRAHANNPYLLQLIVLNKNTK